jgi:hypothetical protein
MAVTKRAARWSGKERAGVWSEAVTAMRADTRRNGWISSQKRCGTRGFLAKVMTKVAR